MNARLLVCEKTGQWATALRWAGGAQAPRIYELRSLLDCREQLAQFPASFLGLEATSQNIEGVTRLLWETHRFYPESKAVVFADRNLVRFEEVLREAGALQVVFAPRRLDRIVRFANRHLSAISLPEQSAREWVWSRLPWKRE